jgi:polysaccharide pyruvyl transferase WcaK-like protein
MNHVKRSNRATKAFAWLDPSQANSDGQASSNLGDLIIAESVSKVLDEVLPGSQVHRFPSQCSLSASEYRTIRALPFSILGGTNAISSFQGGYSFYQEQYGLFFLLPKFTNTILLGVGWGEGYPSPPSRRMCLFYRAVLSNRWIHAVRDDFTQQNLSKIGIPRVINTGCPTLWGLHGRATQRTQTAVRNCLFTVTDYARDPVADNSLIELLAGDTAARLFFFPQGRNDLAYIQHLDAFQRFRHRIRVLEHSISDLRELVSGGEPLVYVGTRLHCAIFCMQQGQEALILKVDHRADEMGRDFSLPVVNRRDLEAIRNWIRGHLDLGTIHLPLAQISKWKSQFQKTI